MIPSEEASWADAACIHMYAARYAEQAQAVGAASLITRHPGWRTYGGPEIGVIPSDIDSEDGLWWLVDLSEVPEARQHCTTVVVDGNISTTTGE